MIRWADSLASQRNVFVFQGKIVLVFSYNKASTHHNNSFYVVRAPCPAIQNALFVYLAYIRPFCDFLTRQLEVVRSTSTNVHLFTLHNSASGCFSTEHCNKSLQEATPESPLPLKIRLYRQVAISIAKKHMTKLIEPFNPNVPKDYAGFVQLLAFQTGHKLATHSSAYALEHAFPSKLQPDLILRYLDNSQSWHNFNSIGVCDYVQVDIDCNLDQRSKNYKDLAYFPDPCLTPSEDSDNEEM